MNSKIRLTIASLILILLIAIGVWAGLRLNSQKEAIGSLISSANDIGTKENLSISVRNFQNTEANDIAMLNQTALNDSTLVGAIDSIEGAGKSLHLRVKTSSLDKEGLPTAQGVQKIKMTLETSGSWANTGTFLYALESLPYRSEVESLNLTKSETGWDGNIVLGIYTFKQ